MRAASGLGPTPPRLDRPPGRTAVRGSADMPGLSDTAYDTAWVAAVPAIEDRPAGRGGVDGEGVAPGPAVD